MSNKLVFTFLLNLIFTSLSVLGQQHPVAEEYENVPLGIREESFKYGDSWENVLKNKKGTVTVIYTHNAPFIFFGESGKLEGIELEIMNGFLEFVEQTYGVELEVKWKEEPSFKDFYNEVKGERNGVLGVSAVSITKSREKEVKFSPPYIPDIEIIVSSGNIPLANTMAEFSEMIEKTKGITLRQSTFEENFKYIKKNYFPDMVYDYSPNLGTIMEEIAQKDDLYAYVQITNYGKALDNRENVNRQRFFIVENPGLAMVMPFESDWSAPVNEYFHNSDFQSFVDSLTIKHLGKTTSMLINEVTRDTTKVDYKVHLGNEIQLLTAEGEIQQLKLDQVELEINGQKQTTQVLTFGFIIVVILIGILFYFYKKQRNNNKELALKNIEIARTAKSLKKSYRDLELLSEAGKDITSNLTFSKITKNVWRNIDALIGTDFYGIGIYDEHKDVLIFKGAREDGKALATFEIPIEPDCYLAASCFHESKEIFVNDVNLEYRQHISRPKAVKFGNTANSVIYFPLMSNGKANGVITMQRREKNSFTDYHFRLLRNLSVYANIALQNAGVFEELAIKSRRLKLANQSITNQKQQIEKQNEDLIQLDHEKNHLIGIVAHDLRSPLSSVMGIINLIKMEKGALSEGSSGEYIQMMLTSLNRMTDLITRILDLHKIESREININLERTNLADILKEIYNTFVDRAEEKKIQLKLEASDAYSEVDQAYTMQIFENLVSNAIKFSPRYKEVHIRLVEKGPYTQIQIVDDGPGISDSDKKKLFGRFQRLTAKPTAGEQSVGLGLSIVKKFVDMMDGEIWCESQIGQGSTFIVQFKNAVKNKEPKVYK